MSQSEASLKKASLCARFRPAPDSWVDALQDLCFDTDQLLVLGAKAITEYDVEKAVNRFFLKALHLDPENPKTHLAMGKALFMVGQGRSAKGYLEKTIALDPDSDEAYFHLGLIARGEGRPQEAEKMMLKALELQPDNANVLNNLGVILLEQGRFGESIHRFEQVLDIYPEHQNARYNLGMAHWGAGNIREAVNAYRGVLQIKPEWSVAANSLAWVLATDGNDDIRDGAEAVQWALVACKGEGGKNPEYLDTLAAAYAEAGQFEQAVKTAQKAQALARQGTDEGLTKDIEHRIGLYRSGKAFR